MRLVGGGGEGRGKGKAKVRLDIKRDKKRFNRYSGKTQDCKRKTFSSPYLD